MGARECRQQARMNIDHPVAEGVERQWPDHAHEASENDPIGLRRHQRGSRRPRPIAHGPGGVLDLPARLAGLRRRRTRARRTDDRRARAESIRRAGLSSHTTAARAGWSLRPRRRPRCDRSRHLDVACAQLLGAPHVTDEARLEPVRLEEVDGGLHGRLLEHDREADPAVERRTHLSGSHPCQPG